MIKKTNLGMVLVFLLVLSFFQTINTALASTISGFEVQSNENIISVVAKPESKNILEGEAAVIIFTVKNLLNKDINIFRVSAPVTHPSFISGERDDEAFFTKLVDDGCTGKALGSGGSCIFLQLVNTRDLQPDSDVDSGVWSILNLVFYQTEKDENHKFYKETDYLVTVVDPVPVPAAGWLFMSALASMGLIGRRRKLEVSRA